MSSIQDVRRSGSGRWLRTAAALALLALAPAAARAQAPAGGVATVRVVGNADSGLKLQVDGRDFMVLGMNWDYFPVGTNYAYSLWTQPDDVVQEALDREMSLLRRMGANTIRAYAGIPARWIRYIYERHGIYTVLNHTVGRYGYELDGAWIAQVDYASPRFREAVTAEVVAMVEQYKNVPGLLMWMLGNENNYGLSWASFEIENLPVGERDAARARYLYSLFGEIIRAIKARDPNHPVTIANGDVQYIDLVAQECKGLDVFGANVYRGISFTDFFQVVREKLGLPVLLTEFGADAFDARRQREDDLVQARYFVGNWREIYENSAGKGRAGNAVGGFTFQWSDGWWKYKQEANLDVHDTNASWSNGGYSEDYVKGQNNMNEEWFGICAKGPPDARGMFDLYPRTGYYALQQVYRLQPYAPGTTLAAIQEHFSAIDLRALSVHYRADSAVLQVASLDRVKLVGARLTFETYSTGGKRISTPPANQPKPSLPSFVGFDHMESFYGDLQVKPTESVVGTLSVNVLGNVARNPINEIYYEGRGRSRQIIDATTGETISLAGIERIKVYKAAVTWDDPWFNLEAFYRTGHFHWAYEGDMFGLYREANYGDGIDIYNADAPAGMEISAKKALQGLKIAFGPQLWWGANPALLVKYSRSLGPVDVTFIDEEQLAVQASQTTSAVVPEQLQRKTTLHLATRLGITKLELGGIQAGARPIFVPHQPDGVTPSGKVGQVYQEAGKGSSRITDADTFGARAKVTVESGIWHWYAQGAYMGLVADAGYDQAVTFTGWSLKDTGMGNQVNALTGLAVNLGQFQVAPNFLWQKPLVGPGPSNDLANPSRNVLRDPFAVRGNRETVGGELMLTFDPTPSTWLWAWDNDLREDARLALSLDFSYRHQLTSQDAGIGILADGTRFAFDGAPPAQDIWEVRARVVSKLGNNLRLVGHVWGGNVESTGSDPRLVKRFGVDTRIGWGSFITSAFVKLNDWGPYDYHRDFNQTFPLQLMGDVAYALGAPRWLGLTQTTLGVRGTLRYLNGYSNRFVPDPGDPNAWGKEFEIKTYLNVNL